MTQRTITYDILVDDENGHPEDCVKNGIDSQLTARRLLREARQRHPRAYIVKIVQTRCREKKG